MAVQQSHTNELIISLLELNSRIKSGIRQTFPDTVRVVAEISEVNINQSGHCYLELIEKNEKTNQIAARVKATIWAFSFKLLRPYFESVTGQKLSPGMKILFQASVEFHEVYGFSLNIKDIDPTYTLGDTARKRQEIIDRLKAEGVYHLNAELEFPLVPQRIAIISSSTAAGYGDFINQISNNRYGYQYYITLFHSVMQGEEAEQSLIDSLDKIFLSVDKFDIVVIIRGGGSQADLDCFNSYWLCYHITQFPIPVITGIGHDRDETIADLVANAHLKTPTAVAEFLINKVNLFEERLNLASEKVKQVVTNFIQSKVKENERFSHSVVSILTLRLTSQHKHIDSLSLLTRKSFSQMVQRQKDFVKSSQQNFKLRFTHLLELKLQKQNHTQQHFIFLLNQYLKVQNQHLNQFENTKQLLDPIRILKRGYSLSFSNGKLIKSISQLKKDDIIESRVMDGSVQSKILTLNQTETNG